ncbi:hypothetical protein Q1695_002982 [Nippostrongylus brasiliensis]|nr:hypothetical protein Q1695_002982 [Nippostrongylus brasiliensis]
MFDFYISVNFVHITMMALGLYVCAKKTEHVHNTSRGHSKPERGPKRITSKEHDLKTKSKESADEVKKSTPREAKEKPKAPVKAAGDEGDAEYEDVFKGKDPSPEELAKIAAEAPN